jgi:hypothetical protein
MLAELKAQQEKLQLGRLQGTIHRLSGHGPGYRRCDAGAPANGPLNTGRLCVVVRIGDYNWTAISRGHGRGSDAHGQRRMAGGGSYGWPRTKYKSTSSGFTEKVAAFPSVETESIWRIFPRAGAVRRDRPGWT